MNEVPIIMVFPRGQLTPKDKERLTKNGVIAVEADDPKAVVQLRCVSPLIVSGLTGDGIVYAALDALAGEPPSHGSSNYITTSGKACHTFIKNLAAQLKEKS